MGNLIYQKMSAVMKDIGPVSKAQTNTHQKYKFRGIDQFVNALHPALVKHGVILVPEVLERTEQIRDVVRSSGAQAVDKHVFVKVKYTFFAEDGSSVSTVMTGEGLDSGDKATNKALSSALKYALIQTFSVPTEDMAEADLETPELGRPLEAVTKTKTLTIPNEAIGHTATGVHTNLATTTEAPKAKVTSFRKKTTKEEPKVEQPVVSNTEDKDWI